MNTDIPNNNYDPFDLCDFKKITVDTGATGIYPHVVKLGGRKEIIYLSFPPRNHSWVKKTLLNQVEKQNTWALNKEGEWVEK